MSDMQEVRKEVKISGIKEDNIWMELVDWAGRIRYFHVCYCIKAQSKLIEIEKRWQLYTTKDELLYKRIRKGKSEQRSSKAFQKFKNGIFVMSMKIC